MRTRIAPISRTPCDHLRRPSAPHPPHNTHPPPFAAQVYYYCKKDTGGATDTCCEYFTGVIGTSLGSNTLADGVTTFDAFVESAGAASECASSANDLATYVWHDQWFADTSVDAQGKRTVTTAYINFEIVRVEFSHQYGLTLYSPSHMRLTTTQSICIAFLLLLVVLTWSSLLLPSRLFVEAMAPITG